MAVVISEEQAKQEKIKKWVEALRSGEYKQCRAYLFDGEGYCCLGVYSKVVLGHTDDFLYRDGMSIRWNNKENIEHLYVILRKFLGSDKVDLFISMNDKGKSFNEIADKIEEMYLQDE